jgi:hypothetical protein
LGIARIFGFGNIMTFGLLRDYAEYHCHPKHNKDQHRCHAHVSSLWAYFSLASHGMVPRWQITMASSLVPQQQYGMMDDVVYAIGCAR